MRVFRSNAGPEAVEFVIGLLVAGGRLLDLIKRRSLTRQEAEDIARTAIRLDPQAEIDLARRLAGQCSTMSLAAVMRLLDILEEVADCKRILPSLLSLRRAPDPRVRSKVVLMIARSNRSAGWAKKCLADPDPRTRASAVEGLWHNGSGDARDVLQAAARDRNNRVAANALFALHRLGDPSTVAQLVRMGRSDAPLFRASAAWAMGETGDPRFASVLEKLAADPKEIVRKRAKAARERIENGIERNAAN